ncbi:tRNA sulfurtransferase ThiI [Clostridium sp. CAG:557]|nr:tRNA sulfurtransferase ThiI [Clostridium sp. CAG:557]
MLAKRGVELIAIHFASPPYTSARAEQKVVSLLNKVAVFSGKIEMIVVPFTKIQEEIKNNCSEDFFTIIMRRFMMKISQIVAEKYRCEALVTGESLGQVASQTMKAIACTNAAVEMPVFRPLIGLDKDEIVEIARKIDTFDISILPYEDCCTVFTPRHPRTKPNLNEVLKEESKISCYDLIKYAVENIKITKIFDVKEEDI